MVKQAKLSKSVLNQVKLFIRKIELAKISVDKIIVFGSHAKGTAHKDSDIDVCVVSTQYEDNHWDSALELTHLKDDSTIDIEVHTMSPRDLANKYDTLASEIRKYGIDVTL